MPLPTRRLLLLALLTLLPALSGCSTRSRTVPTLPGMTPYANAQQLEVRYIDSNQSKPEELTTFTTDDTPAVVQKFYSETLPKDGWSIIATGTM